MSGHMGARRNIAIIGTGISGLSAAWLLSRHHDVTVFERDLRIGGHSNTVAPDLAGNPVPVDTGFIVYNEAAYPNLTALFDHLGVATHPTEMSFSVSLDNGRMEYSGGDLAGLFAQKRNLLRGRFWSMLRDIVRFYQQAPRDLAELERTGTTLGDYLRQSGYGTAFCEDHLLPMAGAIWSAPPDALRDYPAAAFIRFQQNHGLLKLRDREMWRSVSGGSRTYVDRLTSTFRDRIRTGTEIAKIRRDGYGVSLLSSEGHEMRFDHVVIATHADQGLSMLGAPTPSEKELLGAFRYSRSKVLLHTDPSFMPRRRAAWSSWNYLGNSDRPGKTGISVTYWMNRLQQLPTKESVFVTLNPETEPAAGTILHREDYDHPMFDRLAIDAQRRLWSLQGQLRTWYCGAYFGSGFHEDGLQAGLAVAEALSGERRPWRVPAQSGRIFVGHEPAAEIPANRAA